MNTLLFSGGSDATSEAIWGTNELLDWYEKEYNVNLCIRFQDINGEDIEGVCNFEDVK